MPQDTRETDWIEWQGGECPVDPETRVDVRRTYGDQYYGLLACDAGGWGWRGSRRDIIAYRVVQA